jgi:osmoprotectant transport system ATP-binding protein
MIGLDGLSRRYGDRLVIDAVSLTIPPGSIAAIVGASGAGKTTLIRMINRLVKPSAGRVLLDGVDVTRMPAPELRRQMGYVIQNHGLFPHWTVERNVATVPALIGWPRDRIRDRVRALLDLFGLEPEVFAGRYPHELSGGQQQRVGVARALAAEPRVLLMDEPFGALDPIIRAKAREDLAAVQKKLGTTVVFVTHDMDEAFELADRIAVMDDGRLVQYAAPAELVTRPASPLVASLVGGRDRAFRLLSLQPAAALAEPGEADGDALPATASLKDALDALLWSGRRSLPLSDAAGRPAGRVALEAILGRGDGRP